ncbi:MAG: hypothetical protein HQ582_12495 [Planctomycetes bacterium]|nr:hypothetical protein [Planctomycetota bacterium]
MPGKAASSRAGSGQTLLAAALVVIILCPFGYHVVARIAGGVVGLVRGVVSDGAEPAGPFLEKADTDQETCIRGMSALEMRLHHWEHLKTIREEFVRHGHRSKDGLRNCKDCHTSRAEFCDKCHNAVTLTPDCWQCHNYP